MIKSNNMSLMKRKINKKELKQRWRRKRKRKILIKRCKQEVISEQVLEANCYELNIKGIAQMEKQK